MVVIDGAGGYVPLYRIDRSDVADQHGGRGRGESAVPARDENHVTMASEAVSTALGRSTTAAEDVAAVFTASISDQFAEHGIAAQLAYRAGTSTDVRTGDFQASGRAAADALATAREYVRATDEPAVVAAVDVMPVESGGDDESTMGTGAGALVLRPDSDTPVATLESVGQATTGFLERHREHGESATAGDARFERRHGVAPAASTAFDRADAGGELEYGVASAPGFRLARTALEPIDAERVSTFNQVGYAGTATLLLDLCHAIESADPGATIGAVAYGQGGADAFVVSVDDAADDLDGLTVAEQLEAKEYVSYAKHLEYRERYDYEGVPNA
ncbi:hydroxymethylglutaryl-CoA synthase family protein [Salinadaptatus halalkaliphilus]|uniref:Hydroxymethylglutaryl-CoA synthase family protein n=1 Tax=Salinadaptatus halalkaliphilus TaxID=2419781 RepID=A0A4S3TJA2_9EURY|nr:hydroxymethylglutaryl-CoA synthase family protein [Salinadaptatus halalkaliphilus]THE64056.1 hydroxymethylglutaryl-CoA synthase family protein [Salinadaptatus halalkaliphilus]